MGWKVKLGRGAVLASLSQFPAFSSSDRDVQGGFFPIVALPKDSLLPDTNLVCQLSLQKRVFFHPGLVQPPQQGRTQASYTAEI